jgi:hypothetical protein
MRARWSLVLAVPVAVLLSVAQFAGAAVASAAVRTISVTNVKQVSKDTLTAPSGIEPDTQVEPDIDVDPNNAQHVVAVVQNGRDPSGGAQTIAYATSQDGGDTWVTGSLPGLTTQTGGTFNRASDPAVAFGPDGSVYVSALIFNAGSPSGGVAVSRSVDGGVTWAQPVVAQPPMSGGDKEWVAVDTFPASPHFGRIYTAWDAGGPILERYSDDHGQTWSSRITVGGSSTIGARPVVQPNGNLTMVFENGVNVVAATSTDGGVTFAAPVTISHDGASDPPDMRAGSDLPSAAVDRTTGVMYVSWGDTRFRSDGTMDALVSRSTNGGTTWSAPVRANQDSETDGLTHTTPAIAAYGGNVYVTYRTRQKSGTSYSNLVGMKIIESTDGGLTFSGEVNIGKAANLTWSARAGGKFLGDYMGVVANATAVHPVWCRSFQPPTTETYHQTTWSATVLPS